MNARNAFLLSLALIGGAPVVASAADPAPDVKGKWVGKTSTIIAGSGAHWPSSVGTFDKPGLYEKDLTIKDGRKLLYADKDGYLTGDFDGDVLNFCYAHAGGASQTSVVSCTEVKRSR
jgi:hypothetical protein